MNPYVAAGAARAGSSIWNDKIGRILILTGIGVGGFFIVRNVSKAAKATGNVLDTISTVVGLPKKFLDGLQQGWNDQAPSEEAKANFNAIFNKLKIDEKKLSLDPPGYLTSANNLYTAMAGGEMVIRVVGELIGQGTVLKAVIDDTVRIQGRTS